jgi:hypothetical protein
MLLGVAVASSALLPRLLLFKAMPKSGAASALGRRQQLV